MLKQQFTSCLSHLSTLCTYLNIDEADFKVRAELLRALGYKVLISNHNNHQMLINYMQDYKIKHLGLVVGVRELQDIIQQKYYQNLDGRLLVALGELFNQNIKIYTYPALISQTNNLLTASTIDVPSGMQHLYQHLLESQQVVEVTDFNKDILSIYPADVLESLRKGTNDWEDMVPKKVKKTIKHKQFFIPEA